MHGLVLYFPLRRLSQPTTHRDILVDGIWNFEGERILQDTRLLIDIKKKKKNGVNDFGDWGVDKDYFSLGEKNMGWWFWRVEKVFKRNFQHVKKWGREIWLCIAHWEGREPPLECDNLLLKIYNTINQNSFQRKIHMLEFSLGGICMHHSFFFFGEIDGFEKYLACTRISKRGCHFDTLNSKIGSGERSHFDKEITYSQIGKVQMKFQVFFFNRSYVIQLYFEIMKYQP